jgi:hypothetical protein
MADAKGSGGGEGMNEWQIMGAVLVGIVVLNYLFTGNSLLDPANTSNNSTSNPTTQKTQSCGIKVSSPVKNQKLSSSFTLSGYTVKGCGWDSTSDVAVKVQAVDKNGVPVTDFLSIPPAIIGELETTPFSTSIGLTSQPAKGVGYVILVPAQVDNAKPLTLRIPVNF